jgi:hypothetical protein
MEIKEDIKTDQAEMKAAQAKMEATPRAMKADMKASQKLLQGHHERIMAKMDSQLEKWRPV